MERGAYPPAFNGELNGLAVVSADDMWAVGTGDGFGLIFHWDGTQWARISEAPVPGYTVLSGVYAKASNDVWAVGYFEDNTTFVDHMLVERWNGVQWTVVATPIIDPSGDMLNSVGGTSSGEIWVAGIPISPVC